MSRTAESLIAELDRIIGSLYSYTESAFPALVRLAFASKFA